MRSGILCEYSQNLEHLESNGSGFYDSNFALEFTPPPNSHESIAILRLHCAYHSTSLKYIGVSAKLRSGALVKKLLKIQNRVFFE
jgi:hypothetical protein